MPNNGINLIETNKNGGLTSTALKTIAIIAMVLDHCAVAFLAEGNALYIIMRMIGRTTGPIMFYLLVEGYHRTHNIKNYIIRMGVFALISYPAFLYFEYGTMIPTLEQFRPVGVIYTMFLALLLLHVRNTCKDQMLKMIAAVTLFALSTIGDWALWGLVFVLVFDSAYQDHKKQLKYGLFVVLGMLAETLLAGIVSGLWHVFIIQLGSLLPLLLLSFYNGKRGRGGKGGKWFFYIFYPLHLLVIALFSKAIIPT